MRKWIGKSMACLWLAMISYGTFPLGSSAAGAAAFCLAVVLLMRAGLHMECWSIWKAAGLVCSGSALGMLTRYFAEYDEAWWNLNFTVENAARHLGLTAVCGILICLLFRYLTRKSNA